MATGHSVWGILNGPATGEALAELIAEGVSSRIDLKSLRSDAAPTVAQITLLLAAGALVERRHRVAVSSDVEKISPALRWRVETPVPAGETCQALHERHTNLTCDSSLCSLLNGNDRCFFARSRRQALRHSGPDASLHPVRAPPRRGFFQDG